MIVMVMLTFYRGSLQPPEIYLCRYLPAFRIDRMRAALQALLANSLEAHTRKPLVKVPVLGVPSSWTIPEPPSPWLYLPRYPPRAQPPLGSCCPNVDEMVRQPFSAGPGSRASPMAHEICLRPNREPSRKFPMEPPSPTWSVLHTRTPDHDRQRTPHISLRRRYIGTRAVELAQEPERPPA